jgi:hypothetical protein
MSKNVSRSVSLNAYRLGSGGAKTGRQTPNLTNLINQFQSITITYKTTNHLLSSSASDQSICLGHAEGILSSLISDKMEHGITT